MFVEQAIAGAKVFGVLCLTTASTQISVAINCQTAAGATSRTKPIVSGVRLMERFQHSI